MRPGIIYSYGSDTELPGLTRDAQAYCRIHDAGARTVDVSTGTDGRKTVRFECVGAPVAIAAPPPTQAAPVAHSATYIYRSDSDLIQAARNAEAYCLRSAMHARESTIIDNGDGTRTVHFRCTALAG